MEWREEVGKGIIIIEEKRGIGNVVGIEKRSDLEVSFEEEEGTRTTATGVNIVVIGRPREMRK